MERWSKSPDYNDTEVSDHGNVRRYHDKYPWSVSPNQYGVLRVNLYPAPTYPGQRLPIQTVQVKDLVARAFVRGQTEINDRVVVKDGNQENLHYTNLAWRSSSFAWRYTNQLRSREVRDPIYTEYPVYDRTTGKIYRSIMEAAIDRCLLPKGILESMNRDHTLGVVGGLFGFLDDSHLV